MKKFLLGLLCGVLFAGLIGVIFVFSLVRLADTRPSIADHSVLIMRLEGELPEKAPVEIPLAMFEDRTPLTIREFWAISRRAATDSRIQAIVIAPRGLGVGWAKLQELRESLLAFKKSGKPVYALLRMPGLREYYLATAADRIFAAPDDYLDIKGLRLEATFFKKTLDKVGVEMEVEHIGKYKDAYDTFTRTDLSPESREVYNKILDEYYTNIASVISSGRKKTPEEVRALIDRGPFTGEEAKAQGLVDALGYEDQLFEDLKTRVKQNDLKKLGSREYVRGLTPVEGRAKIAFVVGEGTIMQGSGNAGPFGNDDNLSSGSFARLLRRVRDDASVKGVIVRIDSPGGDAIASDDILHEMKELSRKKPMVISMSDVAASGGYFMAATGDPIIAYPNTITGSIGVITARVNMRGLYDKLGVQKDILTRGKYAGLDSDYKPLTADERAKIHAGIESTYRGFVNRVASARKKTYAEIDAVAQGRVWLGSQGRQNGLVDELGGLDRAVELIRSRAKIGADQQISLVPYPPKRSLLEVLTSKTDDTTVVEAQLARWLHFLPGGRWLGAAFQGGTMMLMPVNLEVR